MTREQAFLKQVQNLEASVNRIATIADEEKDIKPISKEIEDLLPSAAANLSGKKQEVILEQAILLQKQWALKVGRKAAGTEIRRDIGTTVNKMLTLMALPDAKLPAVGKTYKEQIAMIIHKADQVKAGVAATGMTPKEAKGAKGIVWAGLSIISIAAAAFLWNKGKKGKK